MNSIEPNDATMLEICVNISLDNLIAWI